MRYVAIYVTLAAALFALLADSPASIRSKVEFYVSTPDGRRLDFSMTEFSPRSGADMSSRFSAMRADGIPSGAYSYRLEDRTARRPDLVGRLTVIFPEHWVVIVDDRVVVRDAEGRVMAADRGSSTKVLINGRVTDAGRLKQPAWVRFAPVFGSIRYDAKVDAAGRFAVHESLVGRYVAVVLSAGEIVGTEHVELGTATRELVIGASK